MANWKDIFINSASAIEEKWDELRSNFTTKLGLNDPIQIVTYRTYGSATHVYIKGRVLEDKKITSAGDKDTILNNLLNMYKRFESDEVSIPAIEQEKKEDKGQEPENEDATVI